MGEVVRKRTGRLEKRAADSREQVSLGVNHDLPEVSINTILLFNKV